MLTFSMLWKEAAAGMGISATDAYVPTVKRNINNGLKIFKSAAQQYYTRKEVVADLVANQQFYTFAPDVIRARTVRINNGSLIFPIPMIESEIQWNALNIIPQFAVFYPQRWFVRGPNEVGVWPIPSTNLSGALIVAYDARQQDMYVEDTTGSNVTVTNGSVTVTCNDHSFTPKMVGMKLGFTDGSDGNWYNIIGYTNDQTITIENFYGNATQTNNNTIIGAVPDIPEEYHPALQDWAMYRYYKYKRINSGAANDFLNDFLRQQEEYKGTFADKESSQIITPKTNILSYNPLLVPPINMTG